MKNKIIGFLPRNQATEILIKNLDKFSNEDLKELLDFTVWEYVKGDFGWPDEIAQEAIAWNIAVAEDEMAKAIGQHNTLSKRKTNHTTIIEKRTEANDEAMTASVIREMDRILEEEKELIEMKCEFLSVMDGTIDTPSKMVVEVYDSLKEEWYKIERNYIERILRDFIY